MMKKMVVLGLVCGAALLGTQTASALGVGVKATTLGAGVDVIMPLSDKFNGRLNVNKYSYNVHFAGIA